MLAALGRCNSAVWMIMHIAGAFMGMVGVEPPAADEPSEGRGPPRTGPADPDSSSLPPGHLLFLTHHGAVPQRVCLQSGSGISTTQCHFLLPSLNLNDDDAL